MEIVLDYSEAFASCPIISENRPAKAVTPLYDIADSPNYKFRWWWSYWQYDQLVEWYLVEGFWERMIVEPYDLVFVPPDWYPKFSWETNFMKYETYCPDCYVYFAMPPIWQWIDGELWRIVWSTSNLPPGWTITEIGIPDPLPKLSLAGDICPATNPMTWVGNPHCRECLPGFRIHPGFYPDTPFRVWWRPNKVIPTCWVYQRFGTCDVRTPIEPFTLTLLCAAMGAAASAQVGIRRKRV